MLGIDDLHEYQKYSIEMILEKEACGLFLEPGLGKTVITLTALWELLFDMFEIQRVLVVAPLRVARDIWGSECKKWDHLKALRLSLVLGDEVDRVRAINRGAEIYIINRENLAWLVKHYGNRFPFDMVILDELSSFKNHDSNRFKAMKSVRAKIKRIVGLTGTPAPNSLVDLWAQVYLLDLGKRLGRFIGRYRNEYFVPDKRNGQFVYSYKIRQGMEDEIYKKIEDICVSMKAVEYIKMPERIENYVSVEMSEKEEELYKRLEKDALLPFEDGDIDAANAAALANKLLQMANGAVYDENQKTRKIHKRKLEALKDLVEAANGKPVLVFYAYKHDRERIKEIFDAGDIDTTEDIEKWNRKEMSLALCHPASAGHGLNLQAGGSIIIWYGLTWSLELYQQANARLWRQGQNETVVIHHIITKNTIDEHVIKVLQRKGIGQSALMDAVRARINKITEDKESGKI